MRSPWCASTGHSDAAVAALIALVFALISTL